MLKKRNISVHIYNEDEIDEMILMIRDSFIKAFVSLEDTLREKINDAIYVSAIVLLRQSTIAFII
jgi:hypothetical protein